MNRTITIAGILAGFALTSGVASALPMPLPEIPTRPAPVAAISKAKLVWVDGASHEFGTIWDHEPVEHDFWFENQGTDPLSIERFQPTCGCTLGGIYDADGNKVLDAGETIRPGQVTFAPGEKGYMRVVFDPKGRKAAQHKNVKVYTNAQNARESDLRFSAHIKPVLHIEPLLINFPGVEKGRRETQVLKIAGRSQDFDIKLDEFEGEGKFEVKIGEPKPVVVDGDEFFQREIEVSILPGVKVGREIGEMNFVTNDPRREAVSMRIVARVIGDLTARPPRLAMGAVEPNAEFEYTFDVISKTATPFVIKDVNVTGSLSGADASFEPVSATKDAYRVTINAKANASSRQSGMIQVMTTMDDEPMVEIPYSAWVRREAAAPRRNAPAGGQALRPVTRPTLERATPTEQADKKKDSE